MIVRQLTILKDEITRISNILHSVNSLADNQSVLLKGENIASTALPRSFDFAKTKHQIKYVCYNRELNYLINIYNTLAENFDNEHVINLKNLEEGLLEIFLEGNSKFNINQFLIDNQLSTENLVDIHKLAELTQAISESTNDPRKEAAAIMFNQLKQTYSRYWISNTAHRAQMQAVTKASISLLSIPQEQLHSDASQQQISQYLELANSIHTSGILRTVASSMILLAVLMLAAATVALFLTPFVFIPLAGAGIAIACALSAGLTMSGVVLPSMCLPTLFSTSHHTRVLGNEMSTLGQQAMKPAGLFEYNNQQLHGSWIKRIVKVMLAFILLCC